MSGRSRVLVCDDETQILRALRVILRDVGFEALPAATGEEALDLAAVHRPDAAIVDLVLPGIDGFEVCRRLREWSEMPIIVLSAIGEEDEKVRALAAGADDYVTKPSGHASSSPGWKPCCAASGPSPRMPLSEPTDSRSISRPGACGATATRSISRRPSSISSACSPATAVG